MSSNSDISDLRSYIIFGDKVVFLSVTNGSY